MYNKFEVLTGQNQLSDYCKILLSVDDLEKAYVPSNKNDNWQIHKKLKFNQELINIITEMPIFHELSLLGYKVREEPTLISWTFDGHNRGAANHYHHDSISDDGGQVSMMLLLNDNFEKTHMRLLKNGSRGSLAFKLFDFVYRNHPIVRRLLYLILDKINEMFYKVERMVGSTGTLFVFNAGDYLHKACPVKGTTRNIFHLNFTLYDSKLSQKQLKDIKNLDKTSPIANLF